MSIVEFDGPPSCSLEKIRYSINITTLTHGLFVVSTVSLASRDQDRGQSNSPIDIYDRTEKVGDCEQSKLNRMAKLAKKQRNQH